AARAHARTYPADALVGHCFVEPVANPPEAVVPKPCRLFPEGPQSAGARHHLRGCPASASPARRHTIPAKNEDQSGRPWCCPPLRRPVPKPESPRHHILQAMPITAFRATPVDRQI